MTGGLGNDADGAALATEAVAAGLAFSSLLCWVSTALVASFRQQDLPAPYWQALPWLRTDSLGVLTFIVAAVSLPVSEYLRLRRRRIAAARIAQPASRGTPAGAPPDSAAVGAMVALAVSETVAVLSTGVVGYLSVNAVTHPQTLLLQVTHLLPGPSEGTLRVAALILCFCSVSVIRYLRALPASPGGS